MEDSDSFSLYMNDIKNIKVLSYEEEKYFCKKNNRSYFDNADDSYDLFISDGNNGNY